jgi:hypothetical protein
LTALDTVVPVRQSHLRLLAPYLVGEQPVERTGDGREGTELEWDMHCPLHEDHKRSAQLNVTKGVWYCQTCAIGGRVEKLIRQQSDWVNPTTAASNGHGPMKAKARGRVKPTEEMSEGKVKGWNAALMSNEAALDEIKTLRGLHENTLARFEIGWDRTLKCYTIPVRGEDGELLNIRRYQTRPAAGRRKIRGVEGHNVPRLYPIEVLRIENHDEIIICEGELDALITNQFGFPCVTRTGSAKVWRPEWNEVFKNKTVYLCHDCDDAGQDGNRRVARSLRRTAAEVRIVRLPYPITEKHGKDLTDYWLDRDGDVDEFRRLLEESQPYDPSTAESEPERVDDASVLDALDSRRVGHPLRLSVTIKGKREPGYTIPRKARFRCTRDAGPKCNDCPLYATGDDDKLIAGGDPVVLELIESTNQQKADILRRLYGIPGGKCSKVTIDIEDHQAVEVLFARPNVDHMNGYDSSAYKNLKLTSVGRHDTLPNNTVSVVGALHPDPRHQLNEFLVWDVARMETSIDRFEMDRETLRALRRFQPATGQHPLKKLREIADDLAEHVTHIYGRPELHAAMDLVFHSAISFDFGNSRMNRGWLDLLVLGDTRTGKSEAAARLTRHYAAGEVVSCESASFAGIIGGLQQFGATKEWAITWGQIPINDRRLVVLDEVSGLTTEEIASMSSVRSSGIAELSKIQQDATWARTRLIWLSNPRGGRMSDYTYGVQAIQPLIGNPEDIARFDLAMTVSAGEVPPEEINRVHTSGRQKYPEDLCRQLIRWVWSRTPEQIVWTDDAYRLCLDEATKLGGRYTEDPPLIQAANAREKVARVAVALAARTFSTDPSGERVIIRRVHVRDAVLFIDKLYGMRGFGYRERSDELIAARNEAESNRRDIKQYLERKAGLAAFLRGTGKFRRQDVEEVLNVDRETANAIISRLWDARMVRKLKGDIIVEPTLHAILRGEK